METEFTLIGAGGEGSVYKSGTLAYKFVNPETSTDLNTTILLSKLNLNRIVTPTTLLYDDGVFVGYTMPFISSTRDQKSISKEELVFNLKLLKKDLNTLSKESIEVRDIIKQNSILNNNGLYIIDTGLYRIVESRKQAKKNNIKVYNEFIKSLLSSSTGSLEGRMKIYKLFKDESILKDMKSKETLEEYSKRLIK